MKSNKSRAMRTKAIGEGMPEEAQRFVEGDEVNIISPHVPEHEGKNAKILSAQDGPYYALDFGDGVAFRWYAESEIGGLPAEAPAPEPPPEPSPDDAPAAARAVARQAGGGTAASHAEYAMWASLGRRVMAETKAANADAAMLKVSSGLVALEQLTTTRVELAKLRAEATTRETDDGLRIRREELGAAVRAGALTRAQAFDVTEGKDKDGKVIEVLTPKAAWQRGTLAEFRDSIATLSIGADPGRKLVEAEPLEALGGIEVPADIAEMAKARGYTPEQTQRLAALHRKNFGGAAAQETTR